MEWKAFDSALAGEVGGGSSERMKAALHFQVIWKSPVQTTLFPV